MGVILVVVRLVDDLDPPAFELQAMFGEEGDGLRVKAVFEFVDFFLEGL